MTNEALAFDPNAGTQDVKVPQRFNSTIVKTPDAASPLVCKILPNPLRGGEVYFEVELIKYMIGPDPKKDTRYRLSRKMLGEKDPAIERFWAIHNEMKALKSAGKENSEEYRKLDHQKKVFTASKKFLLLVLPAGESKPKALEVTWKGIKKLFGAPARGNEPAFVGLVETMRSKGRDPLSVTSETGWIKIWRTGTGLETDWHVQEATVETKDKDGEDVVKPLKAKVNEDLFKLKKADIVDLEKVHRTEEKIWTEEECQKAVDSFGSWIPERCQRRQRDAVVPQQATNPNEPAFGGTAAEAESDDFDLSDVF